MKRTLASLLVATSLVVGAPSARADDLAQAKMYFNAGAQAYAAGQFLAAAQAFDQAYKLAPRPAILFSMAQALRRQYFLDSRPERVRDAIRYYREYVAKVPQGGRRADAAQALAELEPIAQKLADADAAGADAPKPVEAKAQTRLMVSSQTGGATVALDDAKPSEMPLIEEVAPGKHHVKVMADGYFDDEREVVALEGGIVAVDVPLREKPAKLSIGGTVNAEVSVDGRLTGATPLAAPLELTSGRHLVTLTRTGYQPFSEELDVHRGETKKLDVRLATTTQRKASYVLMVTGVAGIAVGAVSAGLAVQQQSTAQAILDRSAKANISADDLHAYDQAIDNREKLKGAAGVALGAGLLVGLTGLVLYAFDQPTVGPPVTHTTDDAPKPAPAKEAPAMEMSAAPMWSPGLVGGALTGRF